MALSAETRRRIREDYPGKPGTKPRPIEDRFWPKVAIGGWMDCWEWTAYKLKSGYGTFGAGGKYGAKLVAHRVAYELLVGEIPEGLDLDHLCRNRACVNPLHLEPVTRQENARRGLQGSLKTECKQGHEYTPENTLFYNAHRQCKTCTYASNRRYREAQRGA